VFSIKLTTGSINKKCPKYKTVLICPNSIKGDSTCLAPNCIKTKKLATNIKKAILLKGLNCKPLDLPKSAYGNNIIIKIEAIIATTPNNLFGIDLKIA
jgi:hypothetical protein